MALVAASVISGGCFRWWWLAACLCCCLPVQRQRSGTGAEAAQLRSLSAPADGELATSQSEQRAGGGEPVSRPAPEYQLQCCVDGRAALGAPLRSIYTIF